MHFLSPLLSRIQHFLIDAEGREKVVALQCAALAKSQRGLDSIDDLREVEFSGFSQWGEDGIIDWLAERLDGIPESFVEFGVQDYRESNTRLLLRLRNWRGLVIDGSPSHVKSIRSQDVSWRYDLTANCAFIDRENINLLLAKSGMAGEIGLLSIDIDGNDYWVWESIEAVSPAIVICEYNAAFGDLHKISVPYRADFQRTKAHYSNLYFGASLGALVDLGLKKGYVFIGTNSNGCNAFFVRKDHANKVTSSIRHIRAFPSSFRESRDAGGSLTFARSAERGKIVGHLPVYDFKTASERPLADLGELYSPGWTQD